MTVPASVQRIFELAEPIAAEHGLEVLDVELASSGRNPVVRVYLDGSAAGRVVGIDDCEAVSRSLGDVLEAHEAVAGRYMLEVSSPGVDRPLRKPQHYGLVVGEQVRVRLAVERDGRRHWNGRLESADGDGIALVDEAGNSTSFRYEEIDKANLVWDFDKGRGRKR